MSVLPGLRRTATVLSNAGGVAGGVIVFAMFVLVVVEVVLRNVFSASTHVMDELVGYGVGASTFLALGWAFQNRALIRIDLLIANIPAAGRRWLELTSGLAALLVALFLSWMLWGSTIKDYRRGFTSGTLLDLPIYIPKALMLVGMLIFTVATFTYFVDRIVMLATARHGGEVGDDTML